MQSKDSLHCRRSDVTLNENHIILEVMATMSVERNSWMLSTKWKLICQTLANMRLTMRSFDIQTVHIQRQNSSDIVHRLLVFLGVKLSNSNVGEICKSGKP